MSLSNQPFESGLEQQIRNCHEAILKGSYSIIVEPGSQDWITRPTYFYSVGAYAQFGIPELAIAGLDQKQAVDLLSYALEMHRKEPFADGQHLVELSGVIPVKVRALSSSQAFPVAEGLYRSSEVPFLQIIGSDHELRYPGEASCDAAIELRQAIPGT